ncbi:MAG: PQQ-like beta-propeller repeat protein [Acidobacteriota bacterium]|nr:MAG: PQQ-like beta-propeller repeat protein [Acidobacteriota bacterium]
MKAVWLLFVSLTFGSTVSAQDWSQWRGPNRDGVASAVQLPKSWPGQLILEWKVEVGEGHSSPVIAGEFVYVHTRQGDDEFVTCLSRSDGQVVWKSAPRPVPYRMNSAADGHGKGPKSTPVISEGQLFTVSITGAVTAWDATTGKVRWTRGFSRVFEQTSPLYGTATSPLLNEGRVYVHVGGHDSGALKALNARTGEDIWSWNGDGPGYASPILTNVNGTRQLVTQSQEKVVGLDAADGALLWEITFKTPWSQNVVTPVVYQDLLVFSGLQNKTFAVRLEQDGDRWNPKVAWEDSRHSMYMNSPVLSGESLYGMAHQRSGQFFCLNAATGELNWVSEGREGENASIVRAGGVLFFLTDEAKLIVIEDNSSEYKILATYSLADSPTWAHLAVQGSQILVKDKTHLASWTWDD